MYKFHYKGTFLMDAEKVLYSSRSMTNFINDTKDILDIFKIQPILGINIEHAEDNFGKIQSVALPSKMMFLIDECYKKVSFGKIYNYINQEYNLSFYISGISDDHVTIPDKCIALYGNCTCAINFTKNNAKKYIYTYSLSIKPDMTFSEYDKYIQEKMMDKINDIKSFIYYLKH